MQVFAQEAEILVKENLAPIGPLISEPLPVKTILLTALILLAVAVTIIFVLPRFFSWTLGLSSILVLSSVAILGVLLPFTLYALSSSTTVLLRAAPGSVPKDVEVLNVGPDSFEVSWKTEAESVGIIRYGTSPKNLPFFAVDVRGPKPTVVHRIKVVNLEPNTTYYFEVISGKLRFNENGSPLEITTRGSF